MLTKNYPDRIRRMIIHITIDLIRDDHCNDAGYSIMDKLVP
jgi:hypothetical protein